MEEINSSRSLSGDTASGFFYFHSFGGKTVSPCMAFFEGGMQENDPIFITCDPEIIAAVRWAVDRRMAHNTGIVSDACRPQKPSRRRKNDIKKHAARAIA